MLAAKARIFFVRPEDDLLSVLYNSVFVKSCVKGGFFAAPADGLDLLNGVRPRKQPVTAGKKIALEVRTQSVADYGNVQIVHNVNEELALLLGEELRLVNDKAINLFDVLLAQLVEKHTLAFKSAARINSVFAVSCVNSRLCDDDRLSLLFIVILDHERVCGLA